MTGGGSSDDTHTAIGHYGNRYLIRVFVTQTSMYVTPSRLRIIQDSLEHLRAHRISAGSKTHERESVVLCRYSAFVSCNVYSTSSMLMGVIKRISSRGLFSLTCKLSLSLTTTTIIEQSCMRRIYMHHYP